MAAARGSLPSLSQRHFSCQFIILTSPYTGLVSVHVQLYSTRTPLYIHFNNRRCLFLVLGYFLFFHIFKVYSTLFPSILG